ncbi:DUF2846 domain-containing protein [Undibacterium terreum]|uniref:DUF2846 domain-containing protein n=1 Tax=Undibacterium terreum TaxID=1224302 RepID=A0A916UXZ3_9BURK|nr:DUF2846 domain-containing protein [Undibacterium terreum]GGC93388.1 hypothetical protein GCM10011396_45830 [Undibacterium terreum]
MASIKFKHYANLATALTASALLSACVTATGPQFSGVASPEPGKGDVYLYRSAAMAASLDSFAVTLDEKKIGSLANGSFLHLRIEPGQHKLTVKPSGLSKTSEVEMEIKSAETMFYKYEFPTGPLMNLFFAGSSIVQKDRTLAIEEMKELRSSK